MRVFLHCRGKGLCNNRDRRPGVAVNPPCKGSCVVIGACVSPGMGAMALNVPGVRGRIFAMRDVVFVLPARMGA